MNYLFHVSDQRVGHCSFLLAGVLQPTESREPVISEPEPSRAESSAITPSLGAKVGERISPPSIIKTSDCGEEVVTMLPPDTESGQHHT